MLRNFAKCTFIKPWIFQHCELFCISCGSSCEVLPVTGEGIYIIHKLFLIHSLCPHLSLEVDSAVSFLRRLLGESCELPQRP